MSAVFDIEILPGLTVSSVTGEFLRDTIDRMLRVASSVDIPRFLSQASDLTSATGVCQKCRRAATEEINTLRSVWNVSSTTAAWYAALGQTLREHECQLAECGCSGNHIVPIRWWQRPFPTLRSAGVVDRQEMRRDLYESQGHRCFSCGRELDIQSSDIDHDHFSGEIRGLACKSCNRRLGP